MNCPDENAIAGFIQGLLPPRQVQAFTQHLDSCSRCHLLVGELARGQQVEGPQRSERPFRDRAMGTEVGRYVIEGTLGQGGMGTVYLAYDPTLDRRVALKVMRTGPLGAQGQAQLLSEARAMAAVSHPHVVPIYDAGLSDEGAYLAMERVEGETLAAWLMAKKRKLRSIIDLFQQAASGLAAAHDAGVVHRDFKPHNVLIDGSGNARVTDFGLALSLRDGAANAEGLVGTLAYISPEQLFGARVDARADQFSFCVALYEALLGERPYVATTVAELRMRMAHRQMTKPARRDVPPPVVRVLDRGLRIVANERYASMRDLKKALDEAADRAGLMHVMTHAGLQVTFALGHWAFLAVALLSKSAPAPPGVVESTSGSLSAVESALALVVLLVAVALMLFGVAWAPLNAAGLLLRRRWARWTTLVYAAFSALTIIGIPYAIYAFWSLNRPSVKRTLS